MLMVLGAILGFLSLVLSALLAHALHLTVSAHQSQAIATALSNMQWHAVLLIALYAIKPQCQRLIGLSGYLFFAGVILFSLSIILAAIFSFPGLLLLTPLGGVILLLAWLLLIISAFSMKMAKASAR